ncbi:hypothetical protein [Pontibacillus salipaludis]|uniref:Uncharacterized protein n=1 Tax=Pontibacillus salipaludis TaxID=1697394 RepID=A0ABQ1PS07_9BACI|nr:hypothetical protein [Pontibacillus salipaludis]GGD02323.1 hypothetical protein GCM10011389_07220 [Pontibacillus salipaludis]
MPYEGQDSHFTSLIAEIVYGALNSDEKGLEDLVDHWGGELPYGFFTYHIDE